MKHMDDGMLHAYLDGAVDAVGVPGGVEALERHLETCSACAARLASERRVRDRANALLSSAAPAVDAPPPFGAVVTRRTPSGPRLHEPRETGWRRLAVSASVVLALGIGWTARDLLRRPSGAGGEMATARYEAERAERSPAGRIAAAPASAPPPSPPSASGTAQSASPGTPDPAAGVTEVRVRQEAEPVSGASMSRLNAPVERAVARIASADPARPPAPPPPPELRAREESTRTAEDAMRRTAPTSAAPSSGHGSPVLGKPAEGAPPTAGATLRLRGASTPRTPTLAGRVIDDAGRPLAGAQVALDGHPAGAVSGADGSYVVPLPAGAADAAEPLVVTATAIGKTADTQTVVAGRDDLRRDFVLKPAAVELSAIVVTGVASEDAGAGWIPVERAEAENALGRPLATIAGLPVTRFAVSPTRDEVLLVQPLEDGGEVRLVQRVDPQAEPPAAPVNPREPASAVPGRWLEIDASGGDGFSRITIDGDGVLIEAEAPVPLHRLRSLLLRLR